MKDVWVVFTLRASNDGLYHYVEARAFATEQAARAWESDNARFFSATKVEQVEVRE